LALLWLQYCIFCILLHPMKRRGTKSLFPTCLIVSYHCGKCFCECTLC
jgi:hypothetical protein